MVTLTEIAAKKVQDMLEKRGKGIGIKIGVKTTGCSGLSYVLEWVDVSPLTKDFQVFETHGVKIWVDGKSFVYLNGMVMDWKKQGLNEGFEFVNPNEAGRCGCGESFNI